MLIAVQILKILGFTIVGVSQVNVSEYFIT